MPVRPHLAASHQHPLQKTKKTTHTIISNNTISNMLILVPLTAVVLLYTESIPKIK